VHVFDGGRFRYDEVFVTPVEFFAAEIIGCQTLTLEMGTGCAVEDENFVLEYVGEGSSHRFIRSFGYRAIGSSVR
jgi:hypothetical protein